MDGSSLFGMPCSPLVKRSKETMELKRGMGTRCRAERNYPHNNYCSKEGNTRHLCYFIKHTHTQAQAHTNIYTQTYKPHDLYFSSVNLMEHNFGTHDYFFPQLKTLTQPASPIPSVWSQCDSSVSRVFLCLRI